MDDRVRTVAELQKACKEGDQKKAMMLYNKIEKNSGLNLACRPGYLEAIKFLVEKGADVMKAVGYIPLGAESQSIELVQILVDNGFPIRLCRHFEHLFVHNNRRGRQRNRNVDINEEIGQTGGNMEFLNAYEFDEL